MQTTTVEPSALFTAITSLPPRHEFYDLMFVGMSKAMRLSFGGKPVYFKFMAFNDEHPDIIDKTLLIEEVDNEDVFYPVLRSYMRKLGSRLAGVEVSKPEARDKRPALLLSVETKALREKYLGPSSMKLIV